MTYSISNASNFKNQIFKGCAIAVFTLVAACGASDPQQQTTAKTKTEKPDTSEQYDLVIHGGPIYTGLDGATAPEAVAVIDGTIASVNNMEALQAKIGAQTNVINLDGAAMYPGFTDAHAHLLGIGQRELTLNLEGVGSIEELASIVEANIKTLDDGAVLYGRGWIETNWPESRPPTSADLDPISPMNPVILERADGHAVVVNSAALTAAGITDDTADPLSLIHI